MSQKLVARANGNRVSGDMFSTVLDKITGYFDKNTFISAFFPSLIFWGLTITIGAILQVGKDAALKSWAATDIAGQVLLLIAFMAWVTFWSFLTVNFRVSLTRLYEGYWPKVWVGKTLYEWREAYWRKHW